jgi:prophage antirepressor-like protein
MEIISKNFQDNSDIRIISIYSKEWFVAKDMAEILGYTNTNKAIKDHCKKTVNFIDLFKGNDSLGLENLNLAKELGNNFKNTKFISESDVWRLIIRSRLPEADKIEEWIMEEVLPSIRKTGSYSLKKEEAQNEKISPQKSLETVQTGIQLLKSLSNLNPVEQIELDNFYQNEHNFSILGKFKRNFGNLYFLPTELGNMIGMSGAEINLILEKKGFQFRDENGVWKPTSSGKEFCLEIGNKFNQLKWRISAIL